MKAPTLKDLPENYNKLSVTKTTQKFGNITALHLAALNENSEILKKLLDMVAA